MFVSFSVRSTSEKRDSLPLASPSPKLEALKDWLEAGLLFTFNRHVHFFSSYAFRTSPAVLQKLPTAQLINSE